MPRYRREDIIELSEVELARLIKESDGRVVHATYPGGNLIASKDTAWAMRKLCEWRNISVPTNPVQ